MNEHDTVLQCLLTVGLIALIGVFTYSVTHSKRAKNQEEQKVVYVEQNEFEVVSDEVEQLKQQIDVLQNQVEILTFEKEEIYTILQSEICKRTELKDVLNLSEDEIELLARLVKCEAGGEPFECKVCVCLVVFNRMYDSNFKNSLSEVIYSSGQFSPVESGSIDSAIPTSDCYFAIYNALSLTYNEIDDLYGTDVLFFRAATEEKVWGKNTTYAFTIGKTDFYRLTK